MTEFSNEEEQKMPQHKNHTEFMGRKGFFLSLLQIFRSLLIRVGVLPFLVLACLLIFGILSDNFLTVRNLANVLRQSVYLVIVSLGQMLVLLTGGFDLSVGTIVAMSSVVGALSMTAAYAVIPEMLWLVILLGCFGGVAAGMLIGVVNGLGVAVFNVSPFMISLGMASVGFGIALYLTGGVPVYGMPVEFSDIFGFGVFYGIPVPVYFAAFITVILSFVLYRTSFGRYMYSVGGNIKAARLSGVSTKLTLFWTYVLCALLSSVAGVLLTARLDTGEANIGSKLPLESIAACVIAGVSLRGGVGRIESVVLGALFIGLVQNGMNLARIESYLQTVVLGLLLIFAVIADQIRLKYISSSRG